jgi:hypothetical protein
VSTLRQRRESTDDKAVRLITTGKLTIIRMDENFVFAHCHGDSDTYVLVYEGGHWHCSCKARTDCSHLRALWLVTVRHKDADHPF